MAQKRISTRKNVPKIWVLALDPFAGFDFEPVLRFAEQMAEQSGARLHAIYALAPAALNWTGEFSGPWMKKYRPVAEQKMREVLGDSPISAQIVTCRKTGMRAAVDSLLSHARKLKASRILISTHARQGLDRWALGSFAETLVLESKIPVMVTNPERTIPHTVRKILIPTDLTKASEKYVSLVAAEAKRIGAEVVLYFKQSDPMDPIVQQGVYSLGGGWVSLQSYVDSEMELRLKQIERLEEKLRRMSVVATHVLDSSPQDLVASIDQAARDTGADMVSVQAHATKFTATLLGSVARGLVRSSSVPVLVHH